MWLVPVSISAGRVSPSSTASTIKKGYAAGFSSIHSDLAAAPTAIGWSDRVVVGDVWLCAILLLQASANKVAPAYNQRTSGACLIVGGRDLMRPRFRTENKLHLAGTKNFCKRIQELGRNTGSDTKRRSSGCVVAGRSRVCRRSDSRRTFAWRPCPEGYCSMVLGGIIDLA